MAPRADGGDDLTLALELADIADAITMARYRAGDLQVQTKPDLTPVTEADHAAERAIRERLKLVAPGDAVIGEEFGSEGGDGDGATRRWIVDPIDGTKSYVRGVPTWSTLIALEDGGRIAAGVVSMPALGRRYWATRGGGAFLNGHPIHVSAVASLADAQMAWGGFEDWDEAGTLERLIELARACWRTRGVGDAWQYMLVAEGAAEMASDPRGKLWDFAALKIVVQEAGGRFTDFAGTDAIDSGSAFASNGLVHEAALAIINRDGDAVRS